MKHPEIGFSGRLAYLRWLRARGRVSAPSDREFADELEVGESWLRKWKFREDPPERRTEEAAFVRTFGKAAATWLYEGLGLPPEPMLWKEWVVEWRAAQTVPVTQNPPAPDTAQTGKGKRGGSA